MVETVQNASPTAFNLRISRRVGSSKFTNRKPYKINFSEWNRSLRQHPMRIVYRSSRVRSTKNFPPTFPRKSWMFRIFLQNKLKNSEPQHCLSCCWRHNLNIDRKSIAVEREIPLEIDTCFLTVTDLNPIDSESYKYVPPSFYLKPWLMITGILKRGPRSLPPIQRPGWSTSSSQRPIRPPFDTISRWPRR